MATVTNPTRWDLFSHVMGTIIPSDTTVSGVDDAIAEEACATGVFTLGEDETAAPVRKARSTRAADVVEEATAGDRETR
jgi:hypothetical protein